ncbi:MAG TPA: succinylglutamate desuccinylase/aspartoacylase family protein, partial [Chloroflexota bacterium]|nr:succinylglutamate desuccinylase/aspartoacylase family protein [Chloroflexota bacterium]
MAVSAAYDAGPALGAGSQVIPSTASAGALLAAWRRAAQRWMGARAHVLDHLSAPDGGAPLLRLWFPGGPKRALLIAGTHGDEPSGAFALLRFFEHGDAAALRGWSYDVLPLVNPLGFGRSRGRPGCPDLNRAFGDPPECPEAAAILRYLAVAPSGDAAPRWDLVLSLHEDPESECLYLYDTGCHERHRFVAALAQSNRYLDRVIARGVPVCGDSFVDDTPTTAASWSARRPTSPRS